MTDNERKLLEMAAKAAGIELHLYRNDVFGFEEFQHKVRSKHWSEWKRWDPLTDDGDALRLANACNLIVCQFGLSAGAMESESDDSEQHIVTWSSAGGKDAAMRLAIVRAAAAIGKAMP